MVALPDFSFLRKKVKQMFYVVSKTNIVFFAAYEYGLGHYHVFTINEKASRKLSRDMLEIKEWAPIAVKINKLYGDIYVYDRAVMGARDMNEKVTDSIFRMLASKSYPDYIQYIFTKTNKDQSYEMRYIKNLTKKFYLFNGFETFSSRQIGPFVL